MAHLRNFKMFTVVNSVNCTYESLILTKRSGSRQRFKNKGSHYVLLIIANSWKPPKCPVKRKVFSKSRYIHRMNYYTALKNSIY